MVYDSSDEEKEAVFGSRKLSSDINLDCRFYYPCRLVIVNEPVFDESLEIASRNYQKDGMKLFCDKIIQSPENIPVALSDQGSSELMDIITKINLACQQALGAMEGERKEEGLYAHVKFYRSAPF